MNYIINLEATGMDCKNDILTEIAVLKAALKKYPRKLFKGYFSFKTVILKKTQNFIKFSYTFHKNYNFFQEVNIFLNFIKNLNLFLYNIKFARLLLKLKLKNLIIETLDYFRKLHPDESINLNFYQKSMILKIIKNILFKVLMVMPDSFRNLKNKSIY
jgi:hypothetical protein